MSNRKVEERIAEIIRQPVRVLNATVGKAYETRLDFDKLQWKDIIAYEFEGLEAAGLHFDTATSQITGVPSQSGNLEFFFKFRLEGEPEAGQMYVKPIPMIINPDPKSLWKQIESDQNDPYYKKDELTVFAPLGDRHILASSKRGRSHANVGSFREDDLGFKELSGGWCIVVVADGAGSAKLSRKGSELTCSTVIDHFMQSATAESMKEFDELLQLHLGNPGEETQKKLNHFVYNTLGKAAVAVHKKLQEFAGQEGIAIKELSTTLIFTLFKRYEAGYAFLSFGVGDCPIAIVNRDISEIFLLNWIDVGEYGGGTRFITMPEIFQNEKFATRFGFKIMPDFAYLFMMSDGIYDAKFVVESNLAKVEKWRGFIADLQGKNEDKAGVEFDASNPDIEQQLSRWMDFWSPGNHDDRTLAIVF